MYRTVLIAGAVALLILAWVFWLDAAGAARTSVGAAQAAVARTVAVALAVCGAGLGGYAARTLGSPAQDLRWAIRHHRRRLALMLAGTGIVFTVAGIEAGYGLANLLRSGEPAVIHGTYAQRFNQPDPVLGYAPIPGLVTESVKRVGDRVVYDVTYTIDERGRRATPARNVNDDAPLVMFFGCSYTFGEGVEDNQTMPFYVSEFAPQAQVVNLGCGGYGPQQTLALLQSGRLDAEIAHRRVIAVYLYIDGQIKRVIGSMKFVTQWGIDTPRFVLVNDRLVNTGSFRDSRPIVNWCYALASRSQVLRYHRLDPPRIGDTHYELTARIIVEAARELTARVPDGTFYLALHPSAHRGRRLVRHLGDAPLRVLDYTTLWPDEQPIYHIGPGDGHPSPLAHRILAEQLTRDLALSPAQADPESSPATSGLPR